MKFLHKECQCDDCRAERGARKWRSREQIMTDLVMDHTKPTESLMLEVLLDIRDMARVQDARLSDIRDAMVEMLNKKWEVNINYPWTWWYPTTWTVTNDDYDSAGSTWIALSDVETAGGTNVVADIMNGTANHCFSDQDLFLALQNLDTKKPHKKVDDFTFKVR